MEFLFGSLKPHRRRSRSTSDLSKFVIESALAAGPDNIIIGPVGQRAIDRIEGNNKTRNLWKSPLVCHLGAVDSNISLGKENLSGTKDTKCSEAISSPSIQSISSPQMQVAETVAMGRQKYGYDCTDEMLISCSSSNSTSSYQSTSTGSAASVGLLHCKWKSGLPYFVFSMDDQGEVYVANPCKVESLNEKGLDYMYFFHSRIDGKSKQGSSADSASDLVGKMKVSNSLILSPNNSKLIETEFVMFDLSEDHGEESSVHAQKSKKLPKKAVDVFRTNHSSKQKYGNASPKPKGLSRAPETGVLGKLTEIGKENLVDNHLPPNLELAAVVVKEYCHENSQKGPIGGWGLKFLENATVEHAVTSLWSSESCKDVHSGNRSESVVSLNVLVPAGLHGGPRTRSSGPSSLTKRWRSGGHCDCGGWDVGCPLTVLNDRSSNAESSPEIEEQESCKSFDLFTEGAKTQGVPTLKMVNIHEGLYFIHFQSSLSALQSFSIGVALVHSRSPSLRPPVYRS
ncbi:uncharacterized protein LOC131245787 isoform X2 [Magnolia sinica]|nr:uncharacterized protein LOC131245787 isoform X2 [Magnolia sinica]